MFNQNTPNTGFGFGTNTNQGTGTFGSNAPGTGGTGAFGTNTNTTSAFGGSAFGQRPNTGLFGSGTPSAFGQPQQNTTTTSAFGTPAFGQNTNTTSAFGTTGATTGGGLFGTKPATTGFGGATFGTGTSAFGSSTGFGSTTNTTPQSGFGTSSLTFGQQNVPVPVTGSQNPAYQITSEKEPGQTYNTNFHAISMMPAYRNASFEELRLADYAQGRRYGTSGAFGTPSTFGGTSTGTPGAFGGFGTTATTTGTPGAFGQPAQPTTTGGFGSGAFGSTNTTTGGFGTTTSAFGQNTPQASGFGTGTTGFGTGTTGAFGSSTTGGFGQTTGTGAFGASKPAFGLGAFGSNTTGATNTGFGSGPATGAFGTPGSTTGGFGTTTSTPQTNTWSGFGSGTQQQPGGFGQATATQENKPAGFGGFGTSTSTPATNTFSGFSQKPVGSGFTGFGTGTGGFGSNTSTSGLGFGNTPSAPGSTGTGLGGFGSGSTNTPGFGSGSSFFNKPATSTFTLGGSGGLGGTTGTPGSTFTSGSTGLFGGGTGFGLGNQNQNTGGGLFSTPQTQQTNTQLQQSIMSSPYGTNPLFQLGGASSYGGDVSKPIAPIATLIPKEGKDDKNPAILAGFRLTPGGGKSRFSLGGSASPLGGSPFSSRKRDVLGLGTPTKILLNSTPSSSSGIELTPEAFVVPKKGLKTLEISRSKRDLNITGGGDVKGIEAAPADGSLIGTSSKSSNVDPRLEKEAREKERQRIDHDTRKKSNIEESKKKPLDTNGPSKPKELDEFTPAQQRKATPPVSVVSTSTDKTFDLTAEDDGTYWTIPSMSTILSSRDVRAVQNFVVGRKGYGQVRFTQPVDLSQVRSIPDIPGTTVVFDLKICTVYPDEANKPPVGRGLNVPATITLEKCWPVSKETRRPIVDVENPRFIAHVERLKRQPETEFIDYIADTGSWIFKVKHFSSYACPGDADNWSTIYEEPIAAPSTTVSNIDDLTVGDSAPISRMLSLTLDVDLEGERKYCPKIT